MDMPCFLEPGRIPIVIKEAIGHKQWNVVKINPNGEEEPSLQWEKKSNQLRKAKKIDDPHPLIMNNEESSNEEAACNHEVNNEGNNEVNNERNNEASNEARSNEARSNEVRSNEANNARTMSSPLRQRRHSSSSSFNSTTSNADSNEEPIGLRSHGSDSSSSVSSIRSGGLNNNSRTHTPAPEEANVEEDPDLLLEEDLEQYVNDEDGDDNVNFRVIGQAVEEMDDKYTRKWNEYQVERKSLVDQKWSVICNPPKQQGIDIGVRVRERHGRKRDGVVVHKEEENRNPTWAIHFDGSNENEHNISSSTLRVLKDERLFKWTVVNDSVPDDPVQPFREHGVVGFDFMDAFSKDALDDGNKNYQFPYLELLIHLWPGKSFISVICVVYSGNRKLTNKLFSIHKGDWRQQLRNLNIKINTENEDRERRRKIKLVSEFEWWAFWGIIFAACPAGKGGQCLFKTAKGRKLVANLNFGKGGMDVMSWTRHQDIKDQIPYAFYDYNCAEEDPYHPVKLLVDGYNDNRKQNIASSIKIVLDESMSSYQPRTTPTSILPNLSFIFRKPKPLGIEQKVCVCD